MRRIPHYLNVTDPLISPLISFFFYFYLAMKTHDNKQFGLGN